MIRLLTGVLLSAIAGMTAISQSNQAPAPEQKEASAQFGDWQQDKEQVLRLINLNEVEAREGEVTHADLKHLVLNYSNLGILYMDAGMCLKAEDAIRRAIVLLKDGPQGQLADEIEQLAVMRVATDKTRQAEKNEMQALQIRQTVGDPVGIAHNQSAIAGLYDEEGKFTQAVDYAEKAYDVLADGANVDPADRIGVRHTLGFALTGLRDCDHGIRVLKDGLELAKNNPGVGDASLGYAEYVLGFGYWHCGNSEPAAEWLQRGTTDMRAEFGWSHAMYVNAMKQYARFLRQYGQLEAAVSAEAVVHQAESVVNASALTGRAEGFRSAGSK